MKHPEKFGIADWPGIYVETSIGGENIIVTVSRKIRKWIIIFKDRKLNNACYQHKQKKKSIVPFANEMDKGY